MKIMTAEQIRKSPHAWRPRVAPDAATLLLVCSHCYSWARRRKDGDYDYSAALIPCPERRKAKRK